MSRVAPNSASKALYFFCALLSFFLLYLDVNYKSFDRAKNIREVKLVYSTLAESMNSTTSTRNVKTIKEGMASKPTASTKPRKTRILNEGDVMANRFKKLAGLIN